MFQTLRNHWKKSLFGLISVSYGSYWFYHRYQSNQIRRFYCQQASLLGAQTLPSMTPVRRVAVLLNGKAYRNKAKSIYDKTIFPLLHLTGVDVRFYRLDTQQTDQALEDLLTNKIEPKELNAVLVVGGDGTLSRLVPYFLRSDSLKNLPICLVPIGEHTSFARKLFPSTMKKRLHDDVVLLCEAVFSLFNGTIVERPSLKIHLSDRPSEPIYASTLEFGHYSALEDFQRRRWYFGYLKYPISSLVHLLKRPSPSILSVDSQGVFGVRPCSGCTRCQPNLNADVTETTRKTPSFFSRFYRSSRETTESRSSPTPAVLNPDCGVEHRLDSFNSLVQIFIDLYDDHQSFRCSFATDFHRWNYSKEKSFKDNVDLRQIRFDPNVNLMRKEFFLDHDLVEVRSNDEPVECRVELTGENLKYLKLNPVPLIQRPLTFPSTPTDFEEKQLEKNGIFLFSRRG